MVWKGSWGLRQVGSKIEIGAVYVASVLSDSGDTNNRFSAFRENKLTMKQFFRELGAFHKICCTLLNT